MSKTLRIFSFVVNLNYEYINFNKRNEDDSEESWIFDKDRKKTVAFNTYK